MKAGFAFLCSSEHLNSNNHAPGQTSPTNYKYLSARMPSLMMDMDRATAQRIWAVPTSWTYGPTLRLSGGITAPGKSLDPSLHRLRCSGKAETAGRPCLPNRLPHLSSSRNPAWRPGFLLVMRRQSRAGGSRQLGTGGFPRKW